VWRGKPLSPEEMPAYFRNIYGKINV
jgi:hypothetical protein